MADVTVQTLPNGPLQISGQAKIVDAQGKEYQAQDPAYLCRCGSSSNKPFCDGTHRKVEFSDGSSS